MNHRCTVAVLCLAVAGCAVPPPPDTAFLPFAAFGTLDNDVAAANQAAWAFAAPARIAGDPTDAARAVAAVDFLAGELASNPRWVGLSPLTKQEMLQARRDLRRALGIAPAARSQVVVDALLRFAAAWQAGDQAAAMQALSVPGFTLPAQQTLLVLRAMPYVRSANIASTEAANQMLPGGDSRHQP